ncbi:MAG TPA: class I SAM-dependent methyltransferase [Streptosporangiaceae bacterium]|nr:class I SAM-dependent methyltransferase [Streptosporangiaceae bacterium]
MSPRHLQCRPEPDKAISSAPSGQDTSHHQRKGKQLGLARSVRLFRLFRSEQTDPDLFYSSLAEDAVDQVARYADVAGRTVVDVGGGSGYFTAAFRARGAECYLVEPDQGELLSGGKFPPGAILADGYWLPVADGRADICFSSNVLEHVADPGGLIDEMIRATRPGGLIYISFTNWYSPWGGHEMSPWHLLGAGFAERRYRARYGRPPKHSVGQNLFRLHVGPSLRLLRSRPGIEVVDALPRYYPRWCKAVVRIPVVREFATWNLLLIVRRTM